MHDTAPRLIGPPQHILELEPISYQYHIAGTILHAPITNDWDANWLNVRMVARDGGRHWTRTEPALLTWDSVPIDQLVSRGCGRRTRNPAYRRLQRSRAQP